MRKELLKYQLLLPPRIEVAVHIAEEGGFWAKNLTFPGSVAQGEDFVDLIEMVNQSLFDYLEVPQRLRTSLGHYVPQLSGEQLKGLLDQGRSPEHLQVEELFRQAIKGQRAIEFSKVSA